MGELSLVYYQRIVKEEPEEIRKKRKRSRKFTRNKKLKRPSQLVKDPITKGEASRSDSPS